MSSVSLVTGGGAGPLETCTDQDDVLDDVTPGHDPVPGITACLFSIIIPIPYSITSDNWAELIISFLIPTSSISPRS